MSKYRADIWLWGLGLEILQRYGGKKPLTIVSLLMAEVYIDDTSGRANVSAYSACALWAPISPGLQALPVNRISLQRCCKPKRLQMKMLMVVSWSKHENNMAFDGFLCQQWWNTWSTAPSIFVGRSLQNHEEKSWNPRYRHPSGVSW